MVRFQEARHIGEGLATKRADALAAQCPSPGAVVINPSARTRSGLVEIEVPGEGPAPGAQVLERTSSGARARSPSAPSKLGAALATIRSQRIDDETYINAIDIDETDDTLEITLHAETHLREWLELRRDQARHRRTGQRIDPNGRSPCASRSGRAPPAHSRRERARLRLAALDAVRRRRCCR